MTRKVILIGDSIRMGYEPTAREALRDIADVWAPKENCEHTRKVLNNLDKWTLMGQADVIHVNCGLHDIRRMRPAGIRTIALAEYEAGVREILERIKRCTRAEVIWAQTTPVDQERHNKVKSYDRMEADVLEYNAAALRQANALGVPVNDLFEVVSKAGTGDCLVEDGVHFTEAGRRMLGLAVADFIRSFLENVGNR